MEQIKIRITECELEYDEIKESSPASDEEIQELTSYFSLPLPEELIHFYKTIGGIESDEIFCISSAQNLTQYMKQRADFTHNSTGIIDMIIAYWGNDRPELQKYKLLTLEETEKINSNFQCIGWMTSEEDIEESSEYVIFDQNGNFTNIYCHQDNIKATTDQLLDFLESGLPERSLENVLEELFERAEGNLSRWD
ncbi:SMI1/KNR4 family protein [Flavobacterium tyrosinilyticum]|uniref:SMI1/KNR4 family protein n=1 Tax=Flavobacterium tyrosinilyticum TaxID=1658740 RepID=UPI00203009FB|nr:SMI1/KNR4 family protein [Flavobacterium tyrosinilyticum]MCM0665816.1 SMI1/KNR4 family protein [Flavobacterium tyrosinilyticum]